MWRSLVLLFLSSFLAACAVVTAGKGMQPVPEKADQYSFRLGWNRYASSKDIEKKAEEVIAKHMEANNFKDYQILNVHKEETSFWEGPIPPLKYTVQFYKEKQERVTKPETEKPSFSLDALNPDMVKIKGGCYVMGQSDEEKKELIRLVGKKTYRRFFNQEQEPQHEVCVKDFEIRKYEVTVGEFMKFVESTVYQTDAERNVVKEGCHAHHAERHRWLWQAETDWRKPGAFTPTGHHPVVCVSWNDAVAYVEWLSKQTGQTYRLPTEAEWEYAVRGGTSGARYWGNDDSKACEFENVAGRNEWGIAFPCSDGYKYPAPVGSLKANPYGLYDMLGNVAEWTCSEYSDQATGQESRCADKSMVGNPVGKGASSDQGPANVRAAQRWAIPAAVRKGNIGFRFVRVVNY